MSSTSDAVKGIISDLQKIPSELNSVVDIDKLVKEIERKLQRDLRGYTSYV